MIAAGRHWALVCVIVTEWLPCVRRGRDCCYSGDGCLLSLCSMYLFLLDVLNFPFIAHETLELHS